MAYTPTELKSIGHFATQNDCIPQLSARPMVRFKKRGSDEILERHIMSLVAQYQTDKKTDAKEKARLAKQKANGRSSDRRVV